MQQIKLEAYVVPIGHYDRIKAGLPILDSFADVTGKWLNSISNQNIEGTLLNGVG